jgi:hypothetical protein
VWNLFVKEKVIEGKTRPIKMSRKKAEVAVPASVPAG